MLLQIRAASLLQLVQMLLPMCAKCITSSERYYKLGPLLQFGAKQ